MNDLTLHVNGMVYGGWQAVTVTQGMEQIAGSFDLTSTDRWPGHPEKWTINPGDECRIKIGNETVITGYVDEVTIEYGKDSHQIKVTGRDKTGDLVDCAAIHKSGQWGKVSLTTIAKDICEPFGITAKALVDVGKAFPSFAINEAETAFECLDRAARMRGVLLLSDGLGGLLLTRSGATRNPTALVLGQNIERGIGHFSFKDRFSTYIVKGQTSGILSWEAQGENPMATDARKHTQLRSKVADSAIKRYRPTIIIADQGDGSTYHDRAVWEATIRTGRAARVTYTVSDWTAAGKLWKINEMITVQDTMIGAPDDLLCAQVKFIMDDSGSRTELELCRWFAFALINLPDKRKKKVQDLKRWETPVLDESSP